MGRVKTEQLELLAHSIFGGGFSNECKELNLVKEKKPRLQRHEPRRLNQTYEELGKDVGAVVPWACGWIQVFYLQSSSYLHVGYSRAQQQHNNLNNLYTVSTTCV